MTPLLLDENLSPVLQTALRRRNSEIKVLRVGELGAPARGTKDTQLLHWIEAQQFLLVSKDRSSMQRHLNEYLASDRRVPGILWLRMSATYDDVLEDLELIATSKDIHELRDRIALIPL